jgi:hypothetical protein
MKRKVVLKGNVFIDRCKRNVPFKSAGRIAINGSVTGYDFSRAGEGQ